MIDYVLMDTPVGKKYTRGWVPAYRSILNESFASDRNKFDFYMRLLMMVAHTKRSLTFYSRTIYLDVGQLVISPGSKDTQNDFGGISRFEIMKLINYFSEGEYIKVEKINRGLIINLQLEIPAISKSKNSSSSSRISSSSPSISPSISSRKLSTEIDIPPSDINILHSKSSKSDTKFNPNLTETISSRSDNNNNDLGAVLDDSVIDCSSTFNRDLIEISSRSELSQDKTATYKSLIKELKNDNNLEEEEEEKKNNPSLSHLANRISENQAEHKFTTRENRLLDDWQTYEQMFIPGRKPNRNENEAAYLKLLKIVKPSSMFSKHDIKSPAIVDYLLQWVKNEPYWNGKVVSIKQFITPSKSSPGQLRVDILYQQFLESFSGGLHRDMIASMIHHQKIDQWESSKKVFSLEEKEAFISSLVNNVKPEVMPKPKMKLDDIPF